MSSFPSQQYSEEHDSPDGDSDGIHTEILKQLGYVNERLDQVEHQVAGSSKDRGRTGRRAGSQSEVKYLFSRK